MPDTAPSVLRRKLAPPRPRATPGQEALQHMLAKTMPRDADELLGLPVAVTRVVAGRVAKADLIAGLNPNDLIFLMQSDPPAPGLCTLSATLLVGLIEVQMSGRVSSADPPERPPTPVDGIVASCIVDRWIATARVEAEVQEIAESLPFFAHRRGRVIDSARSADLTLEPVDYSTLTITLDLADGTRTGTLFFALPAAKAAREPIRHDIAEEFRNALMETPTELSAVLTHLPLTLARVKALAPGAILDVPITALGGVTLQDGNGNVLARGRLGQTGGKKAVRVTSPRAGGRIDEPRVEFLSAVSTGETGKPAPPDRSEDAPGNELKENEISESVGLPELPDLPD